MKPFHKIIAALLAVIIIASAAGCVPVSFTKEWGYKYADKVMSKEYPIGMYIYSLYQAYSEAKTYAAKAKGYKENEPFTDLKITDGDGKKAVAKDWIKNKAEENMLSVIATDYLCKKYGATWDEAEIKTARKTAKDSWDMGPYANYGYYQPIKDEVEKYGVSEDSYKYIAGDSTVKQSALFKKLYDKNGVEEVKDKELSEFFEKNYTDCSYIPVHLYKSSTDASGNSKSEKFKKDKIKKIKGELQDIVDELSNGSTTFDKAAKKCEKEYGTTASDEVKDNVTTKEELKNNNADISSAVDKMKNGDAKLVVVGEDGDSPTAYIVVKNDIGKDTKKYVKNDSNRTTVLQNMKKDALTDLIKKEAKDLKKSSALTVNSGVIDKYDAGMFYEKPEETTAADTAAQNQQQQ